MVVAGNLWNEFIVASVKTAGFKLPEGDPARQSNIVGNVAPAVILGLGSSLLKATGAQQPPLEDGLKR